MDILQSMSDDMDDGYVVRIRGLPWSASHDEVASFLEGVNIVDGKGGIHFTFVRDGRPSGEAYIELESEADVEEALKRDKNSMGKRYIEVFRSKRSEMEWVVKRNGPNQQANTDAVIRLRGLPFGCSKEEIAHFFTGLEIVPNGITLMQDYQGRTTGDAYVQFASQDIAEQAMGKHKEKIGHRYIEIFKSSLPELRQAGMSTRGGRGMGMGMGRPGPYDRSDRFMGGGGMGGMGYGRGRGRGNLKGIYDDGYDEFGGGFGGGYGGRGMGRRGMMGGMGMGDGMGMGRGRYGMRGGGGGSMEDYESQTGHSVHMRGLPFAANEDDILNFFRPLNPVNVVIHMAGDGRATGEADVDFATHEEAQQAMSKDRESMKHRYIELFLRSTPAGRHNNGTFGSGRSGFGGGFGNNGFDSMSDGYGDGDGYGGGYGMGSGMGGMGSGMGGGMGGNPNYTAF